MRSKRAIGGMVLRALSMGLGVMIVLPVVLALGALAVGHLAGGCGPGSSGGCEMGAAGLALYAAIPSFVLGAGWSVFRDLRKR
ncbi:MAG: hypothetical protein KUA43_11005 [Hoeflea sp.]|uniref:hypothetical protein n=1 Tax=Hoeflea sp. TaxID=1940281 RepID=UPI001D294560|nr:hypothetical protein [Hoeflea sp.]MBU4529632.1 hypothetical protein [Alphaproteobacteria bacterium]MBU4546751.1 hypothetical protein [Alphaproteobacteria bacterium]MBU4551019.1 hypothetical protein [Alphaproteobacteria bacterium]MBV1723961.1 hypothetical protein [Hoeflea sp.]MBV1763238.1 hypothetical protein [Hoeflea sp.]